MGKTLTEKTDFFHFMRLSPVVSGFDVLVTLLCVSVCVFGGVEWLQKSFNRPIIKWIFIHTAFYLCVFFCFFFLEGQPNIIQFWKLYSKHTSPLDWCMWLLLQCEQRPTPITGKSSIWRKKDEDRAFPSDWPKPKPNRTDGPNGPKREKKKKMIAFLFMNFDGHMASFRFIRLNVNIESNWYRRRFIPYGKMNHCGTNTEHWATDKRMPQNYSFHFFFSFRLRFSSRCRCRW